MALKLRLKAHETIFIGSAVIQNGGDSAVTLIVKNRVPILRSNIIMKEEQATTPARRLYFLIQLSYMFGADRKRLQQISSEIASIGKIFPALLEKAIDAGMAINDGDHYNALKIAAELMELENPGQMAALTREANIEGGS